MSSNSERVYFHLVPTAAKLSANVIGLDLEKGLLGMLQIMQFVIVL